MSGAGAPPSPGVAAARDQSRLVMVAESGVVLTAPGMGVSHTAQRTLPPGLLWWHFGHSITGGGPIGAVPENATGVHTNVTIFNHYRPLGRHGLLRRPPGCVAFPPTLLSVDR